MPFQGTGPVATSALATSTAGVITITYTPKAVGNLMIWYYLIFGTTIQDVPPIENTTGINWEELNTEPDGAISSIGSIYWKVATATDVASGFTAKQTVSGGGTSMRAKIEEWQGGYVPTLTGTTTPYTATEANRTQPTATQVTLNGAAATSIGVSSGLQVPPVRYNSLLVAFAFSPSTQGGGQTVGNGWTAGDFTGSAFAFNAYILLGSSLGARRPTMSWTNSVVWGYVAGAFNPCNDIMGVAL